MQPPNNGKRIYIRVRGRQKTGYYSEKLGNIGWWEAEEWITRDVSSLDAARDAMRQYFQAPENHRNEESKGNANRGIN